MPFMCSICGEEAARICARCTKDVCGNHLCEKCFRCSDCCECDLAAWETPQREPATTARAVFRAVTGTVKPEPDAAASPEPLPDSPILPSGEPEPPTN